VKPAHKQDQDLYDRDLFTVDEWLALDIDRLMKRRAERVEAGVAAAKNRSPEEEKALDARTEEALRKTDRLLQAMRRATADPEEIAQEIAARADELRRGGARTPVAQAEKEIAEQLGHASGPALNRWLRRHR
jgi:hypothetical protein